MGFNADVMQILIASPGDVGDERAIIPDVIAEWNAVNSFSFKTVLLPVKWEANTYPALGRPQEVINQQIVKDCDILVGVFWTRIGTETGKSISGTVEEIEQFIKTKKPVMLYFSQSPVDPDAINIEQLKSMRAFRDEVRLQGLTESYAGVNDFRNKFARQLNFNISNVLQSRPKASLKSDSSVEKVVSTLASSTKIDAEKFVLDAIRKTANSDGWSNVPAVGKHLATYNPINYRAWGFDTFTKYLRSIPALVVKQEKRSASAMGLDTALVRFR